jgi:O-antigen/teichoic acid export membrane protein
MLALSVSKHIFFSFLSKLFQIGAQCYSLAIITKVFDQQDTGLWLLFFHFVFFFSFFDLGIGGSFLQNRLASLHAKNASYDQKAAYFFEKFFQTVMLYLASFVILSLISSSLTSQFFSNIKYSSTTVQYVFVIFCFFQLMRFPLNFWGTALFSCEKSHLKSILEILENCGLIILASSLFYCKAPLFSSLIICSIFSFSVSSIFLLFTIKHLKWSFLKIFLLSLFANPLITLKSSFPFWLQNILSTFLFSFSPLLFTRYFGISAGSDYILSFKICSLIVGIHIAFLSPLIPFYRICHERNQQSKSLKKLIESLIFSLIFLFVASCLMRAFIEPLLRFWTKREVYFYFDLLPWMVVYCLINVFSIYLNALDKVTRQNVFLIIGLCLFFLTLLFIKPTPKHFCFIGWVCLLPLFISNILEFISITTSSRSKKLKLS